MTFGRSTGGFVTLTFGRGFRTTAVGAKSFRRLSCPKPIGFGQSATQASNGGTSTPASTVVTRNLGKSSNLLRHAVIVGLIS